MFWRTETGEWWRRMFQARRSGRRLGVLAGGKSIRSQIDRITGENTAQAVAQGRETALVAGMPTARSTAAFEARAKALHEEIDALMAPA